MRNNCININNSVIAALKYFGMMDNFEIRDKLELRGEYHPLDEIKCSTALLSELGMISKVKFGKDIMYKHKDDT